MSVIMAPLHKSFSFVLAHRRSESHFCEQQAHGFISRQLEISLIFFQPSFHLCWMALSLAAGYRTVAAFQSGSMVATCLLNSNYVLLWLDSSLMCDVTAVTNSDQHDADRQNYHTGINSASSMCWVIWIGKHFCIDFVFYWFLFLFWLQGPRLCFIGLRCTTGGTVHLVCLIGLWTSDIQGLFSPFLNADFEWSNHSWSDFGRCFCTLL